jgi:hypothetical protein
MNQNIIPTTGQLHAARAKLKAALQHESEALRSACAARAGGAGSDQAVKALRSAQAAHALSSAAAGELRAVSADLDRADAVQCHDAGLEVQLPSGLQCG